MADAERQSSGRAGHEAANEAASEATNETSHESSHESGDGLGLRRELGFWDLTLFYVVSAMGLRWIATAAASGASSLVVWVLAWVGFFLPLAASVLELARRYPQEGGLYVWTREAFGEFSGFMAAWMYWMSNLPYFPSALYFAAGSALALDGRLGARLAESNLYFVGFCVVALGAITWLNMRGVSPGKWLNNAGAVASWLPVVVLLGLGAVSLWRFGSATHFDTASLSLHWSLKNAIFWSTIFYAFSGVELASCMGGEIRNVERNLPRALVTGGLLVTLGYLCGTAAILVLLPAAELSGLGGFMQAMTAACVRLGVGWLAKGVAVLITVGSLGAAGAYLGATSRLPFVAGIDRFLPAAFARIHPRWKTPWVAVLVYGVSGMVFVVLSQVGNSVSGAYDLLVSMSVITYFLPYLLLFAALVRVLSRDRSVGAVRRWWFYTLAGVGTSSTVAAIGLALVPGDDEPNKALAVGKLIGLTAALVGGGVLVYAVGRWRQRRVVVGGGGVA